MCFLKLILSEHRRSFLAFFYQLVNCIVKHLDFQSSVADWSTHHHCFRSVILVHPSLWAAPPRCRWLERSPGWLLRLVLCSPCNAWQLYVFVLISLCSCKSLLCGDRSWGNMCLSDKYEGFKSCVIAIDKSHVLEHCLHFKLTFT